MCSSLGCPGTPEGGFEVIQIRLPLLLPPKGWDQRCAPPQPLCRLFWLPYNSCSLHLILISALKEAARLRLVPPLSGSPGGQQPSLLSRFGRRGIVLLTLGLVGPCGVGGAAAGSSTGIMTLRFLLGFLLAGVDLGVYLMRKWPLPENSALALVPTFLHLQVIGHSHHPWVPDFSCPVSQLSSCPGLLNDPGRGSCCFLLTPSSHFCNL